MATGITKREQLSSDALNTGLSFEEKYPLPSDAGKCVAELQYPNKTSINDIITPNVDAKFLTYNDSKFIPLNGLIESNAVVLADNCTTMQSLLQNYSGKVSLIYLDPPFQTGMNFQSRQLKHAYNDKLDPVSYIEFMRRRFILMRELLSNEGSLYVHIGHQMVFHLKVILDEIFGAANFNNMIVRKKCSSKNYTSKQYPNLNDYILFYSKTKNYKWNQPGDTPPQEWIEKEYPKIDKKGKRYKLVPVHAPGTRNGETGKPWRGKMPPPGKHWQLTPAKLDELDSEGLIHWSRNGNPRRKVYLPEDKQVPLTDYWDKFRDAHHQSICITGYPTEKNLHMLKKIVGASSDKGDLVIDPFCGSGTTLQAAQEQDRKWIGIDNSFAAIHAVLSRFFKGLKPMGDYVNGDSKKKAPLKLFPELSNNGQYTGSLDDADMDFIVDQAFAQQYPDELAKLCDHING